MVLNEVYVVMATDALTTSHPLSFREDEINTPAEISEVFDTIAYSKVGAQRAPALGRGGLGARGAGAGAARRHGAARLGLTRCVCRERRCCGCSLTSSPRTCSRRGCR